MNTQLNLSNEELKMFSEVADILTKYKKTKKFGFQLIHSHFDISKNEVLHETNNKKKRLLNIKPIKISDIPQKSYATSWSIDKKGTPRVMLFCCDGDNGSGGGK